MISERQPLSGVTINEADSKVGRLFERQLPAGLRLALHTHDFFLLTVVTRGGFEEQLSGIEQHCLPGDVRLLPAADAHTNRVEANAECVQIEIAPPVVQTLADIGGGFAVSGRIGGALVVSINPGNRNLPRPSMIRSESWRGRVPVGPTYVMRPEFTTTARSGRGCCPVPSITVTLVIAKDSPSAATTTTERRDGLSTRGCHCQKRVHFCLVIP